MRVNGRVQLEIECPRCGTRLWTELFGGILVRTGVALFAEPSSRRCHCGGIDAAHFRALVSLDARTEPLITTEGATVITSTGPRITYRSSMVR